MILIDSDVFMYAAGRAHPNKKASAAFLRRVAGGEIEAVVDAEVLQEILHRYRALGRWSEGAQLYDLARRIVPIVLPMTEEIVDEARVLLDGHGVLMVRDALHAAVARRSGATLCSYDRDFDVIAGLQRLEPDALVS